MKKLWIRLRKVNIHSIVHHCDKLVPEMEEVSAELKDLIKKILVPANQRPTIEEIFEHSWMKKP